MTVPYSDPVTGWSFDCETEAAGTGPPEGGMVLKNIRHRSNNFAYDLRLVGIRILVSEVEPSGKVATKTSTLVTLGPTSFTIGPIQELKPSPLTAPPVAGAGATFFDRLKAAASELVMLKSYFNELPGSYSGYGLRVDYKSNASLFSAMPNCEVNALNISQIFLFSTYGKSPPHEPGSVLMAARCHPLTTYAMVANSSVDKTRNYQRIESIRFDYRIHLAVDSVPSAGTAAPTPKLNNAGLFRDKDTASVIRGAAGLFQGGRPMAYAKGAFAAVEKGLVLEVVAPGTSEGLSAFKVGGGEHWCWDNVHWWGNRGSGPMISTPGAFHATHMHWRWGKAGSAGRSTIPEIDTSGRPAGLTNLPVSGSDTGGLLVDPRIWIQTINVAVVSNDPSLDPNHSGTSLAGLCEEDWKSLFTGLRAKPAEIVKGAEIVCWYSTEVNRELTTPASTTLGFTTTSAKTYTNKPEGTVFLHGLFFAHEPEITGFGIGDTGPLYWPNSESAVRSGEHWIRDAT
jgi:hypothetical protein